MGLLKKVRNKNTATGLSPEEATKAIISINLEYDDHFIENTKELFNLNDDERRNIFNESVKSRFALISLAVNTYNPKIAREFYEVSTKEIYIHLSNANFINLEKFAIWEKDLRNCYLLENNGQDFLKWTRKYQNIFQMKSYESENNVDGKPLYQLTYRLLQACGVDPHEAELLEVTVVYKEAFTIISGTNYAISKNNNFIL